MWFAKRKDGIVTPGDVIARMIAAAIVGLKLNIVASLVRYERRRTPRQKKMLLLLFCAIFGGYCLFILAHAFVATHQKTITGNFNRGSPNPLPPYKTDTTDHFKNNR